MRQIVLSLMNRRGRARVTPAFAALWCAVGSSTGTAQSLRDAAERSRELSGEGWKGFADVAFLGQALLALMLATLLGALLAYHPRHRHTVDSVDGADAVKSSGTALC